MSLDISNVDLVSTTRSAPKNGAPSSQDYNDTNRELLADIGSLAETLNSYIIPILNALPETAVDGLEGRTIYASLDADKTPLFYSTAAQKHLTVAEVMTNLYQLITGSNNKLVDVVGRITSLQSKLATTSHNDVINAVQGFTDQIRQVSYVVTDLSRIASEHAATLANNKTAEATQALTSGQTVVVSVDWSVPFADNTYTAVVSLEGSNAEITGWVKQSSGAGLQVTVHNTAGASNTVTVHAIAKAG